MAEVPGRGLRWRLGAFFMRGKPGQVCAVHAAGGALAGQAAFGCAVYPADEPMPNSHPYARAKTARAIWLSGLGGRRAGNLQRRGRLWAGIRRVPGAAGGGGAAGRKYAVSARAANIEKEVSEGSGPARRGRGRAGADAAGRNGAHCSGRGNALLAGAAGRALFRQGIYPGAQLSGADSYSLLVWAAG